MVDEQKKRGPWPWWAWLIVVLFPLPIGYGHWWLIAIFVAIFAVLLLAIGLEHSGDSPD